MKVTTAMKTLWGVSALCLWSGCALVRGQQKATEDSDPSNFEAIFHISGADTDAIRQNRAALAAFQAPPTATTDVAAAEAVKVFSGTIPPELALTNTTVSVREGSSGEIVGSVELKMMWGMNAPDGSSVLPSAQKAANVVGADVAFCPPSQKRAPNIWSCFLVKTGAAQAPAKTPPSTSM